MARRRVKFVWGARKPTGGWKAGLWGEEERRAGPHRPGLLVNLRGLLLWAAGAGLALYLAGGTVLYFWFDRSPYNLITWSDTLLLPVRREAVRELRGRMMIAEGLDDLKAKRWGEAQVKLRVGIARAPHENRARIALAQFYMLANQRKAALKVLTDGLVVEYPGRAYLGTLFRLALQGEDYEVVIAACDRFLPKEREDAAWLTQQKVQALIGAGRAAEALPLTEGSEAMLRELRVLAFLEVGRSADAVAFLAEWRRAPGADPAQVTRLQVRALREAGRIDEMKAALAEFERLAPTDPRAQVYSIVQLWLAKDQAAATQAFDRYVLRFSATAQNLIVLATAVAEAKAVVLAQRCAEEAALHGFPAKPFKMALLQAQVAAGEWAGAARTLGELKGLTKEMTPVELFSFEWISRLTACATGPNEAAESTLLELLQGRPLPVRLYSQTVELLLPTSRTAVAGRVLDLAERNYGASRTLAALRGRVDEADRAAKAATPAAPAVVVAAISEREFFAQLAGLEKAGRWSEAAAAIRKTRVAGPRWLAGAGDERVLEAQMRVAGQTGDTLELLGALNAYLNGDRNRSEWVVGFARELHARRPDDAGLVLREVLRHSPDFPPAVRLKREWQPAVPR